MRRAEFGHTDEVYFDSDGTVLKLFNQASKEQIEEEIKLLKKLEHLKVPKVMGELFTCRGKLALRYTKLEGKSKKHINSFELEELALFLKEFHALNLKSNNPKLFTKKRVRELVLNSNDERLKEVFNSLKVEPKESFVIHGDLFWDNIVFEENRLGGVFDFIDACEGDPLFELAVVSFSFGLNCEQKRGLLRTYGMAVEVDELNEYIKYALVYYCACRVKVGRDYKDLMRLL
ncbi:phosphotransferase [Sulfurimonas sp.]|uniref:phosphotransferase n=1 Tax=Sulfurimonas sp. TaxID=2022749 RepID=UPI00263537DE|nr:phosphotransferase [Sulfurimonas sp.]